MTARRQRQHCLRKTTQAGNEAARNKMSPNSDLLAYSVQNPEPIYDPAYQKEYLVIRERPDLINDLMEANRSLLEYITAYGVNQQMGNNTANEQIITQMIRVLGSKNINTSEFTSFWECCDVSYSVYRKLSAGDKRLFLERITQEYLKRRHQIYQAHGYTFTTLQVKADSFAHKRTGEQGSTKVIKILESHRFTACEIAALLHDAANARALKYMLPNKKNKEVFHQFLQSRNITFAWSRQENGKLPDYVLLAGAMVAIVEHKHMKELGGGQDKQILEISHFLRQRDNDVIYVSFLDGILFNRLFSAGATGKVDRQQKEIWQALEMYSQSYFVNTAGFERFVREFALQAKQNMS
ncbi:MAG TPA: hypothetical protein P5152_13610 [Candidatus Paceibacterota bacterium]|nr:hypothetical protein [Candidatus Paceibacterota bacterium]